MRYSFTLLPSKRLDYWCGEKAALIVERNAGFASWLRGSVYSDIKEVRTQEFDTPFGSLTRRLPPEALLLGVEWR